MGHDLQLFFRNFWKLFSPEVDDRSPFRVPQRRGMALRPILYKAVRKRICCIGDPQQLGRLAPAWRWGNQIDGRKVRMVSLGIAGEQPQTGNRRVGADVEVRQR